MENQARVSLLFKWEFIKRLMCRINELDIETLVQFDPFDDQVQRQVICRSAGVELSIALYQNDWYVFSFVEIESKTILFSHSQEGLDHIVFNANRFFNQLKEKPPAIEMMSLKAQLGDIIYQRVSKVKYDPVERIFGLPVRVSLELDTGSWIVYKLSISKSLFGKIALWIDLYGEGTLLDPIDVINLNYPEHLYGDGSWHGHCRVVLREGETMEEMCERMTKLLCEELVFDISLA